MKYWGAHKPRKVSEFDSGQGKVGKVEQVPENVFCLWCVITIVMVTQ